LLEKSSDFRHNLGNSHHSSRMSKVNQILQFWFGASLDKSGVKDLFTEDYQFAAAGYLDGWQGWPHSCLALILLLDQLPRNLFRGTAAAFDTDSQALAIAQQAIQDGTHQEFLPIQRWFFYLPLEHCEDLATQEQCLTLFEQLPEHPGREQALAAARQHHQIIQQFGRFPHRNILLGRNSTAVELEYLRNHTTADTPMTSYGSFKFTTKVDP
jgi:uncharacterized protein (DUF924 family)